jgi:hypothetical protein
MNIYKFRASYEDDDSIFRDIEIKPSQTINDLESIIISSYNLPASATGNFYKSNDNWQRLKQLNIAPVPQLKKGKAKAKGNANSIPVLVAFIDDPHQKLIYEYKGTQEFTFLIELISLTGSEKSNMMYPASVKQQGPSPFKKEELVAHFSKAMDDEEEEIHVVDSEEVDVESMTLEGEEEVEVTADESESEEDVLLVTDEAEEVEEEPADEDATPEDFVAEEFDEDFTRDAEEDFH